MQLDERMLSNCDVTGLVTNALSLCVFSIPCTRGHFYRFFGVFFFLRCYALSAFVRAEIQFASVFVRSEIQSATLFHRAIVTLQLFELTSRDFAVRFIGKYLIRRMSIGEIVAVRIRYVVLATRRVQRIYTLITSGYSLPQPCARTA
ncbi:hypothetical protein ALC60_04439 [Trachymyrmex zeteki]|nr:hypothetical protein ALC60_04439 [Trachymyrmex zeteki]